MFLRILRKIIKLFFNARRQYAASTKLLSFLLGADPRIVGKKIKCQEVNLGKITKIR